MDECSQAISKSVLLEEQDMYAKKVFELQFITSYLSKALTETEVIEVIHSRVFRTFHATSGIFFKPSANGETLQAVTCNDSWGDLAVRLKELPLDYSYPILSSLMKGDAVFIESEEDLRARFSKSYLIKIQAGFQSFAALPLTLHNQTFGILLFVYKQALVFSENTKKLMQSMASHCAEALERSRLYDLSEKAVKARDTLISISAHELLTPVAGSMLQMQLMRRRMDQGHEITPEMIRKMIDQTERQLERLNRLVSEMLDLSRINLGKLTLQRTFINVSHLVWDLIERMMGQMQAAGCKVRTEIEPQLWGHLDSYRIEQVLGNLLSNAARYARGKPVQISLKSEPQGWIRLEVVDQGIGIHREDQERIFQRFERAASIDEGSGLGLGLFVVKQIVEAHGGSISLESEMGQGCKFTVRLQLQEDVTS